jgi:hypothetical protein
MKYFHIEPEVVGGAGHGTLMDRSVHPPNVSKLRFEFDFWPHDALVEGFPCWLVAAPAMERIKAAGFTGVRAAAAEITTSDLFQSLNPNRQLPKFLWLKVEGTPCHDDFGVSKVSRTIASDLIIKTRLFSLVISDRALKILQELGIAHASIYEFTE